MVASCEIAQAALWVIAFWGRLWQQGEAVALGEQLSSKSGLERLGAMGSFLADV